MSAACAAVAPLPFSLRRPRTAPATLRPPIRAPLSAPRRPVPPRRFPLPTSASAKGDATAGVTSAARDALLAIRAGMALFRMGDVSGSMVEFDRALNLDPSQKAYLWQRGLSLYYLNRFEEGAEQFMIDAIKNSNDTEESLWCFLCQAQIYGVVEARKRLLKVGHDSRRVMRDAYIMFKDDRDPNKLVSSYVNGKSSEYFYASLYAGLYEESKGNSQSAKQYILAASQSPYASSDDYMAALAKVHCLCRNWC